MYVGHSFQCLPCVSEQCYIFILQPLVLSKADNVKLRHFMVVCLSLLSLLRLQGSICLSPNYSHISTQMYIQQKQTGKRACKHGHKSLSRVQVINLLRAHTNQNPSTPVQHTNTILILALKCDFLPT